jgi:hypothetical protein
MTFLIQDSSNSFDSLLPPILTLCMEQLFPSTTPSDIEVKQALFALLYNVLLYKGKLFFVNQTPEGMQALMGILFTVKNSFEILELSIFKQNLEALQLLNQKHKLYSRNGFLDMKYAFLNTFMTILVDKSCDLLRDQVIEVIFGIASINFEDFYDKVKHIEKHCKLNYYSLCQHS